MLYGPEDGRRVSFERNLIPYKDKEELFDVLMDVDSLIWVGAHIPSYFCENTIVFPCPDPRKGIHRNIHLTFGCNNISQIPNVEIAAFGSFKIVMFFPNLMRKSGSKNLSQIGFYVTMLDSPILQSLYECVIRPALQYAYSTRSETKQFLNGIPASYYSFLETIRNQHGQLKTSGVKVPKQVSLAFFLAVDRLARSPVCEEKFGGKFYLIYAKGLKETIRRDISGFETSELDGFEILFPLFSQLMRDFPLDCFIDTAITISNRNHDDRGDQAVFFSKRFINKFIANLPLQSVYIDNTCNFDELRGFRSSVKIRDRRRCHLMYIQAYYNEKNVLAKNAAAKKLVTFQEIDALNQSATFKRNINHLKDTLNAQDLTHFGARIEIRTSAVAFQYMLSEDFQPFLQILTQVELIRIPTYSFLTFKVIAADIYAFLLKHLSERYIEKTERVMATARMFCVLLDGLVSKLDDWSLTKKLLQDLAIYDMHPLTNYIFFDRSNFEHETLLFYFPTTSLNHESSLNLNSTMSCEEISELMIKAYRKTVWDHLATKYIVVCIEHNSAEYPDVSAQSLRDAGAPVHFLANARSARQVIEEMFQFKPKVTTGPGIQNWASLPITILMQRLRPFLTEESIEIVVQRIYMKFKSSKVVVPAYNKKQFWITKRDRSSKLCINFVFLKFLN